MRRKKRSIFRLIFFHMLRILCLEFILLFGCLYFGKVGERINENERSVLDIQTDNRKNYLENMLMKNHELTLLADRLDSAVMKMAAIGRLDLDALSLNRENINSIQSQHLNEREEKEFVERYAELSDRIVVELTESEDLNREVLERKQKFAGFTGDFALDDYGSGYSNSQYFLELSLKYLKLDRSIVQNVDRDVNKQQLISYIVGYAHQNHLNVIAEGLETQEELEKTLELGVDFFQGYYLARPMPVPGDINPKAVELILHKKE